MHWEVRVQGKFTDPLDHLTTDAPEKPPVAPVTAPKPPEVKTYTVKRGDTVWAISRKYGVTVKEIADWSGLQNANIIRVGQKLTIKK